jgi:hypothetical protein
MGTGGDPLHWVVLPGIGNKSELHEIKFIGGILAEKLEIQKEKLK